MDHLADTNVLLRRIQRTHPEYRVVREAINRLQAHGNQVCLVPQSLIEMWAVCTRPVESNGLGLLPTHSDRIVSRLESIFPLLKDTADIYDEWRQLVVTHAVSGKKSLHTPSLAKRCMIRDLLLQ